MFVLIYLLIFGYLNTRHTSTCVALNTLTDDETIPEDIDAANCFHYMPYSLCIYGLGFKNLYKRSLEGLRNEPPRPHFVRVNKRDRSFNTNSILYTRYPFTPTWIRNLHIH